MDAAASMPARWIGRLRVLRSRPAASAPCKGPKGTPSNVVTTSDPNLAGRRNLGEWAFHGPVRGPASAPCSRHRVTLNEAVSPACDRHAAIGAPPPAPTRAVQAQAPTSRANRTPCDPCHLRPAAQGRPGNDALSASRRLRQRLGELPASRPRRREAARPSFVPRPCRARRSWPAPTRTGPGPKATFGGPPATPVPRRIAAPRAHPRRRRSRVASRGSASSRSFPRIGQAIVALGAPPWHRVDPPMTDGIVPAGMTLRAPLREGVKPATVWVGRSRS